MIKPEDYDADAPAAAATGVGTQYAPSSAGPRSFSGATTAPPASPTPSSAAPNPVAGIVVVAAIVLGLLLLVVVSARNKAIAERAQAAADAADEAQRSEELRLAERARVEQGIQGTWSNGASRLTIRRNGNTFTATYLLDSGSSHNLRADVLANNEVKLRSDQVGKLVNPLRYWQGDFSQESWLELGADGGSLSARFAEQRGGRTVMMTRTSDLPPVAQRQQETVIEQPPDEDAEKTRADERQREMAEQEEARAAARRAASEAAEAERERARLAQEANAARTRQQFVPTPQPAPPDPRIAREAILARLSTETSSRWNASDAVIKEDIATGYLRAAELLRAALSTITAFERTNGSDSTTRSLFTQTVQKFNEDVIAACNAENRVNRATSLPQVPCPPQN